MERYDDAEALYKRSLDIVAKSSGKDHPDVALIMGELASIYRVQGRLEEAERMCVKALAIKENDRKSQANLSHAINDLGLVYSAQGRWEEASALFQRSLDIQESLLGPKALEVADTLQYLAATHRGRKNIPVARAMLMRALETRIAVQGKSHPAVAENLNLLATLNLEAGDLASALDYSRRASAALLENNQTAAMSIGGDTTLGLPRQRAQTSLNLVSILRAAANAQKGSGPDFASEAFQAAQWAVHSKTSAAIQQLSVRFAAGSDDLAKLVREQQDLMGFWRDRDRALIQAIAGTKNGANPETDGLRRQIASTEERLSAIARQLEAEFPTYATLASPRPLSTEELKGLLSSDEALVFYSVGENGTSAFAATRDGFAWAEIPLGAKALSDKVGRARVGLGVDVAAAAGEKKLFDMGVAHELYTTVLAPFEKLVAGKKHLLVVPTGALTSLPFHLLITAKPSIAQPGLKDLSAYRTAAWLIRRHAITVLAIRNRNAATTIRCGGTWPDASARTATPQCCCVMD